MPALSSPASASVSDGYSPRSSPTRSNNVSVSSYLPSQAAHTSPARDRNPYSDAPSTSHEPFERNHMPSAINFDTNGFSGVRSLNQHSTFTSRTSTIAQEDGGDEMICDSTQPDKGSRASSERPLILQENQQAEYADPMEELPSKDWKELEARYERDMDAAIQHEQAIMNEIEWVMKMMKESTIASSRTECERAKKRLRTRIAYVNQSEEALVEKRTHYKGVVDAFQNAMALLGGI